MNIMSQQTVPATMLLLNIDRDGYQAQLAAERAAAIPAGEARDGFVEDYESNAAQTTDRFNQFLELAQGIEGEEVLIENYRTLNVAWI